MDWGNPGAPSLPAGGDFFQEPQLSGAAPASSGSSGDKQKFIDDGKAIYQKYISGGYLDADGIPDLEKAPQSLQTETSDWAQAVEQAGFNVDDIIDDVAAAFM